MAEPATAAPRASLSTLDAAAMLVGIVIGIGIFKTPSLVANFVPNETYFIGMWVLGGFVTFVGALCYAELGCVAAERRRRIPVPEGCLRPEGQRAVRLGALQRDPAGRDRRRRLRARRLRQCAAELGPYGPAIYAVIGVLVVTGINFAGTLQGKQTQLVLSLLTVAAVLVVAVAGFMAPATVRAAGSHRGTWSGAWRACPWCSCC